MKAKEAAEKLDKAVVNYRDVVQVASLWQSAKGCLICRYSYPPFDIDVASGRSIVSGCRIVDGPIDRYHTCDKWQRARLRRWLPR